MSIKIWRSAEIEQYSAASSIEYIQNDQMQVGLYILKEKETLNIVADEYDSTNTIILLEGEIKIYSQEENHSLKAHDVVILVNIEKSYCLEAITPSKIIAVTSEANQNTDEDQAIAAMLADVEKKDVYTLGHSQRVALYSKRLALGYESTYNVINLSMAANMHDIGKINTPLEILQKPGHLTNEEFDIVKMHPVHSYNILRERIGEKVALTARQHHERLDGSGYPDGLRGNEISMDARIIAIADVFDAMTCKRIYNEPRQPIKVVEYLEQNTDKYDAVILSILRRKVENGEMNDILTAFVPENKNE